MPMLLRECARCGVEKAQAKPECVHSDLRLPCLQCRFFPSMIRDIARSAAFFALACTSRFRLFFFMRTDAAANRALRDVSRFRHE